MYSAMDIPISDAPISRDPSPTKQTYHVFLTVHHRGELSLGEHRRRLGFSSYHWAILLTPTSEHARSYAFDTTNGVTADPLNRSNQNPDFNWIFRWKGNVNPASSDSLLIRMAIGEVQDGLPGSIRALLQSVQLPIKGAWPPQNCVDWIRAAVCKLRLYGYAGKVEDLDRIMARALAYADLRMLDPIHAPSKLDYLGNEM